MEFDHGINEYIKKPIEEKIYSQTELKKLVSVIDLTTLNPNDNEDSIKQLCAKANSLLGVVAAVCVYPQFVATAKDFLQQKISIGSVANFPSGTTTLANTLVDIQHAISCGANEIDIVLPYTLYQEGKKDETLNYIQECKKACGDVLLKVILEISEFERLEDIYALSKEVISAGADFIKTSTGKSKHGATLAASSAMLLAIKACSSKIGFKASGGIKTVPQAFTYIELAGKIMGEDWVTPANFRIGASTLLDEILSILHPINRTHNQ